MSPAKRVGGKGGKRQPPPEPPRPSLAELHPERPPIPLVMGPLDWLVPSLIPPLAAVFARLAADLAARPPLS